MVFQDTLSCVRWMYQQLEDGCQRYPGFYPPCAGLCPAGYCRRQTADAASLAAFWKALCVVLQNDTKIRADAFTGEFTVEKFADILFSL